MVTTDPATAPVPDLTVECGACLADPGTECDPFCTARPDSGPVENRDSCDDCEADPGEPCAYWCRSAEDDLYETGPDAPGPYEDEPVLPGF